jgi:uroporphyrinogen-III synthase
MRALITRPIENAGSLAAALEARGVAVILEPLLAIRRIPGVDPPLDGVQALLFTSGNGARAFAAACPLRDRPVFAVGESTAKIAAALGFRDVESAGGDVAALALLVASRLDPRAGALLHAAGSVLAGDLAGLLAKEGFAVRRSVLYAAEPAREFGAESQAALARGDVAIACFFSPRTAAHFASLARASGLAGACRGMTALCLSPAVAAAAAPIGWRRVITAERPTEAALLAAFDHFRAAPDPAAGAPTSGTADA